MHVCSKINLSLAVTGKRPDGYHSIETLFYPMPHIADELQIAIDETRASGLRIECDTYGVPCAPEKNLCGRAASAYFEQARITPIPPLTIRLTKNIPVAAGMGGGSSDAAHTLRWLQHRYCALSDTALHAIAAKLGADVPFFLNPVPSIGCGIGDKLTPVLGLPEYLPIRIFAPQFPVSAAWAYKYTDIASKIPQPPRTDELVRALQNHDFSRAAHFMRNDLEDSLYRKFPILTILRDKILACGALKVMVSGSGPTLFALFPDNQTASDSASWTALAEEFHILVL